MPYINELVFQKLLDRYSRSFLAHPGEWFAYLAIFATKQANNICTSHAEHLAIEAQEKGVHADCWDAALICSKHKRMAYIRTLAGCLQQDIPVAASAAHSFQYARRHEVVKHGRRICLELLRTSAIWTVSRLKLHLAQTLKGEHMQKSACRVNSRVHNTATRYQQKSDGLTWAYQWALRTASPSL